jgi:hypothetical protein
MMTVTNPNQALSSVITPVLTIPVIVLSITVGVVPGPA